MIPLPFLGSGHELETSHLIVGGLAIVVAVLILVYILIGGFSFAANVVLLFLVFLLGGAAGYSIKNS